MKLRCFALCLLAIALWLPAPAAAQGSASTGLTAGVDKFDPSRDAARDIDDAVVLAHKTGKRVLLDVGGGWCVWCRRLDSLFVSHPALTEYRSAHYVTVKVNWSKENKNEKVLSRYPPVAGYPHLFVLDDEGKLVHSQETGALEKGKGHDPEKVMAFMRQWSAPATAPGQ